MCCGKEHKSSGASAGAIVAMAVMAVAAVCALVWHVLVFSYRYVSGDVLYRRHKPLPTWPATTWAYVQSLGARIHPSRTEPVDVQRVAIAAR
jgi:hypothetical protein